MEQKTKDQIHLLFVMPSEDETAAVRAALAHHPLISVIPCKTIEMLAEILARQSVDAVCLMANMTDNESDSIDGWIAQLKALDDRLPIIVLASPATRALTVGLMADRWITVLSEDNVPLPCFPALLRKLIDYEHTQRIETDFYLKDARILIQALISANTQLAPHNVLAATCQQIREALDV